ncbi:hypothetical protein [Candidatus Nanosyncoccus alces]|uniref:Uncharacterized protein n=1 Tax=Candidatus Nanosyncoccus alces TaxID=2171997 RepID=A0ABY0FP50_9BACT|nr:hypothetical protein [Candidatus Nanosyncoccus alces]RYC75078.1 hypothetical protein G3RUM_00008 [Candidatus Nanosyncoccus alces]
MVDKATEAEWEKSKRIEAERMKAVRALETEKSDSANVAYLDPQTTKVKGWSSDKNVILASIERLGNRSVVLAVAGVALGVVGYGGGMVTSSFQLGMAGVMISGLPSGAGFICLGLAVLMAVITIGSEIWRKVKHKQRVGAAFGSAIGAIVIVVVYVLIRWLIIRFG